MSRPLQSRSHTEEMNPPLHRACMKRDEHKCRLEIKSGRHWVECGKRATDAAHIYPRRECAGAIYHVDVVVASCRLCHTALDAPVSLPDRVVRIPPEREHVAYRRIVDNSKLAPPRRLSPK